MSILLVSLNKQVLKHLLQILNNDADICGDMTELDSKIKIAADKNSIVCLDVSNCGDDVILSVKDFLSTYPNLKILALSSQPNITEGTQLLELGVRGYVNSRLYETHLIDAIKTIKDGSVWIYPDFIYSMVKIVSNKSNLKKSGLDLLTSREKEVAKLALDGLSNKEIAMATGISERTVKAHLSNVYTKFNVKDRIGFVLAVEGKAL